MKRNSDVDFNYLEISIPTELLSSKIEVFPAVNWTRPISDTNEIQRRLHFEIISRAVESRPAEKIAAALFDIADSVYVRRWKSRYFDIRLTRFGRLKDRNLARDRSLSKVKGRGTWSPPRSAF